MVTYQNVSFSPNPTNGDTFRSEVTFLDSSSSLWLFCCSRTLLCEAISQFLTTILLLLTAESTCAEWSGDAIEMMIINCKVDQGPKFPV